MKADKDSVKRKISIARGQLDGILKMIDDDRYCVTIADQILASSAILKKAAQEVLEAHIRSCVRNDPDLSHVPPSSIRFFQSLFINTCLTILLEFYP